MWLFDEDKDLTEKEIIDFANDGGDDAVRHFPKRVLNDKKSMLCLVKNDHRYTAMRYCSDNLKNDMNFLKEVAIVYPYWDQDNFFKSLGSDMQNNKELLDIFAAKLDSESVKKSQDDFNKLNKILNKNLSEEKTKTKFRI